MRNSLPVTVLALIFALLTPIFAQDASKRIALTDKSDIPAPEILKGLRKDCPNTTITKDETQSDYTLEAVKKTESVGPQSGPQSEENTFDLTLFDLDAKVVHSTSTRLLGNAVKDICHAIIAAIVVEIVDTSTLTQSTDVRDNGGIIPALTGRNTHTDTASIYVIANGEHATLDCYERRTGCTTIGPGKYYGELDGDSLWIDYDLPLTHKHVRNHYKIAGSW